MKLRLPADFKAPRSLCVLSYGSCVLVTVLLCLYLGTIWWQYVEISKTLPLCTGQRFELGSKILLITGVLISP